MKINEQRLRGNWKAGWALDLHTISSKLRPNGAFDTVYTEVGEAMNQLKYHSDTSKIVPLADVASKFMQTRLVTPYLEAIIPVPPSDATRSLQPVLVLAREIGKRLKIPVFDGLLIKTRSTAALKDIEDPKARKKELQGVFKLKDKSLSGKKVLLFDDLYRSGATLTEITDVLYNTGKVQNVYVLTITKTRSKK
jgi:predicted amidophosphoribosyltransferase